MNFFNKKTPRLYFLFVIIFVSFFMSSCERETNLSAKKGIIDVRNAELKDGRICRLNGEWEFYFGELLEPSDFKNKNKILKKNYIHVPNSWTNQKKYHNYPEYGYATYRLTIMTNDTLKPVLIDNKRIFTSCKIWLNGMLLQEIGKVSKTSSEYTPDLKLLLSQPVYLKKKNELIIQVSNYVDRKAGIISSVRVGDYNSFYSHKINEFILMISVLSIIFIIGLYHFIMFLFIKTDYSYLVFSILALFFIILGLVGTDTLLKNILSPSFNTITRYFHSIVSLYPTFIFLFFYLLFKSEVNKKLLIISSVISGLLLIFSLIFPIHIVREYVFIKVLFILIVSLYFIFYSLPKSILKKRQGAKWAYIGMLLLFLTNINDILFTLDLLKTRYLAVYGFLAYIIFQSMNIAERFSFSYKKNRNLTEELRIQNKELQKAKIRAENADKLKSAFLANMSHEIRTPMNAIIGFSDLLANDKVDKDKRKRLTSYIVNSGNSLLQLINDIIDVSKIEADQIEINKSECSINKLFEELELTYSEKEDSDFFRNTKLRFVKKYTDNLKLITDEIRLKQVLINLIDNALKFTENGIVEVICELSENKQFVLFSVKDTGIGMTEEQKEIIFQRFIKLENEAQKLYRGAGLGLSISESIIRLLGGKIWVESELNKGTTFYFTIPYQNDKAE
ncbi:MAG: hypothetical protein DRI94_01685 [Bacteroidetes bacterium]|nr:MAG: hypothetical protein DRI94_01685 [Bacteroidota bacterium]